MSTMCEALRSARLLRCLAALLVCQAVALANPLTGNTLRENGPGWWVVVTALIALVEWPVIAYCGRFRWHWALLTSVVANVLSGLAGPPWAAAGRLFAGYGIELVVVALAGLLPVRGDRPRYAVPLAWLAMNLLSSFVVPLTQPHLPNQGLSHATCMSNQRRIYTALAAYCADCDGDLPSVTTARELRTVLAPRLGGGDAYLFCCPATGSAWSLYGPHDPETVNYLLRTPLAPRLPAPSDAWGAKRSFLTDDRPRHAGGAGRVYLYYDGHASYRAEAAAPPP